MNEAKRDSCYTLNVLSQQRSVNEITGSITTKGGMGVGKNIYVKDEICANEMITRNNARIGKNLYVMGTIEADDMFYLDNEFNSMVIKKNIVSNKHNNMSYDIGHSNNRWNNIFSNRLDTKSISTLQVNTDKIHINDGISIGANSYNNNSMMYIENDTIIMNGSIVMIDTNMVPIVKIDQTKNNVEMIELDVKKITNIPQIVIIDENSMDVLIQSNLILLKVTNRDVKQINFRVDNKVKDAYQVKIILLERKVSNNKSINVFICDKHYQLLNEEDYIDTVIYNGKTIV